MTRFVFTDPSGATNINVVVKTNIIGFLGSNTSTPRNGLVMDLRGLSSDTGNLFKTQSVSGARILKGREVQTSDLIAFASAHNLQLTAIEEGNQANTLTIISQQTLDAPGSFTATVISATEIDLSWTATPGGGITYTIDRATNVGFTTGVSLGIYSSTGLSFHNTGLTTATHYYYRIKATKTNFITSAYSTANGTTS